MLDNFYAASDQKISKGKCQIFFSDNTPTKVAKEVCKTLDMAAIEDQGKYLGVPAFHGRVTREKF